MTENQIARKEISGLPITSITTMPTSCMKINKSNTYL